MRSTALLTSALAIGAIAKPLRHQHKRYFVTVDELDVVTVTKYVTPGYGEPAPTPAAIPSSHSRHHHSHSSQPAQQPSSAYVPPPVVVSTPAYTPPAPSSTPSAAVPVPSSAAPVYSSPAAPSSSAAAPSSGTGGSVGSYAKYAAVKASSGKEYADSIVFMHNVARSNHGHPELTWDDSLASVAQQVANTCKFKHWAPVEGQGQNLFAASGSIGNVGKDLLAGWYTGEYSNMTKSNSWNLAQPSDSTFEGSGHLTQMVWKDTTKVGCASIDCSSKGGVTQEGSSDTYAIMHVCQYTPPGNYANQYAKNVGQGMVDAAGKEEDLPKIVASIATAAKKSY